MPNDVLFAPMAYSKYDRNQTLPMKFERMLKQTPLADMVKGKSVAIKMHVGDGVSYSTIAPVFIRSLVSYVKEHGGNCFLTDHYVYDRHPENRGYTESQLGAPILDCCGHLGKYFYPVDMDFRELKNVDIAGLINDADVLIDLSHVKGHGACGFGGACKNIAMGCVTDRTRHQLHSLEGGLVWDSEKCTRCDACIGSCNHFANSFKEDKYSVFFHNCTLCQHCVKVCPTGAITLSSDDYGAFQKGMALATKTVLDTFDKDSIYFINVLTAITALCDCWGMTTPSLVPDIGIVASKDIVAIERASLDLIKMEDLIAVGVPEGYELTGEGHLFQQLHGKDPYIQLRELENCGLGSQSYNMVTIE